MINAIQHLKTAAEDYRRMTTPDANVTAAHAALRNAKLADEFEFAAEALRKLHNGCFTEGILQGMKSLAESCNARRERKALEATPEV